MRIWQRTRRWCFVLPVAALALGILGCPSTEERIEEARKAVPEALARGDRMAARAAVADLSESTPETPEEVVALADLLMLAGETPRALWMLEAGAKRFPDDAAVQLALANAALRLANPSLARSAAASVPEGSPLHPDALALRAQGELGLGELETALATMRELEERYPDRPQSRMLRIATLTSEKRHAEAAEAIEEALAAVDESEELRATLELMRAQMQLNLGEQERAIDALRARVAADPYDLQAWQLLVQGLQQAGRGKEAIALLEGAVAEDALLHDLYALLGPLYAGVGRPEDAERALRTFADASEHPAAMEPLVRYLAAKGDAEGVAEAVRVAAARFPEEAPLRLLLVETLIDQGELAAAREEADAYSDLPGASEASEEYLRARFELAEGDAAAAAERLTRLAPTLDHASTQYWLGRALEAQGDVEGARRRYGLAVARDPAWPAPMSALLMLDARRGDWRGVAGTATRIVRRTPGNLDAWRGLIRALIELEEGQQLLAVSDAALQIFPENAEFRIARAHALRLLGRTEEARAELEQAEGVDEDAALAGERALALAQVGLVDRGLAVARANVEAHPDDARAHAVLASLYFGTGAAAEGDAAVDRALELEPGESAPLYDRCRFRTATGRWAGALEDCTRYAEARPADARAQHLLGAAYTGAGQTDEAIASYRRAVALDERNYAGLNNLATLLAREGDLDAALEAGQEAYRLSDGDPFVADTLGDLYLRKGLVERAIALLEGAMQKAPEMPDARLHLAQAYTQAGRAGDARVLLAALDAELPPDHALRPQVREAVDALP